MGFLHFYLSGEDPKRSGLNIDISTAQDVEALKKVIAGQFGIVEPQGIAFHAGGRELEDLPDIEPQEGDIAITIDGHNVRDVPGPAGLPIVGSYFEGGSLPFRFDWAQN